MYQGAKKVILTACHSGKLKLTFTSPNIISTSPKNVLMSRLISQFFCNLNSSKKFTCPSGKLITEFTSPIAKSTSPGLSDTTFFAQWCKRRHLHCQLNLAFTNLMTSWKRTHHTCIFSMEWSQNQNSPKPSVFQNSQP